MSLSQRFWALFRADHRAYQEAYAKYERYATNVGVRLSGPSASQISMASGDRIIEEIVNVLCQGEGGSSPFDGADDEPCPEPRKEPSGSHHLPPVNNR